MYKVYHPIKEDSLGQGWREWGIEDGIRLCPRHNKEVNYYLLRLRGRILDAGCGSGEWVEYLKSYGYEVYGIELSEEGVKRAKDFDPKLNVVSGDIRKTNYDSKFFDSIISLGVLEHIEEGLIDALCEMKRILKDNGIILLILPTQNLNRKLIVNPLKSFKRWVKQLFGVKYQFEEYRYEVKEFSDIIESCGFKIIDRVSADLISPNDVGIHTDYPFLRNGGKLELNLLGRIIKKIVPNKLIDGGTMWVCNVK